MQAFLGADKLASCFALNGKLSDKSSEDAKHFEKKSQVIFCHPLNTQVPLCRRRTAPKAIFSGRTNLYSATHDGCPSFLFLP